MGLQFLPAELLTISKPLSILPYMDVFPTIFLPSHPIGDGLPALAKVAQLAPSFKQSHRHTYG